MEEIEWFNTYLKLPPTKSIGIEYLVTVRCEHWKPKYKTMHMVYEKVPVRGKETFRWLWNGQSCISTWEVTDWAYMPKPARQEE